MRVFLYEYTCAVADPTLPPALRAEGRAMLRAVAEDFSRLPGVCANTLVATGWAAHIPGVEAFIHGGDERAAFRQLAAAADFTLVIAPETDNILESRCRWVLEAGGRLLGPRPDAVGLTGDKYALAQHFQKWRIRTPESLLFSWPSAENLQFPMVLKPRFGAASQATFLVHDMQGTRFAIDQASGEIGEFIVQAFVPGTPASVAILIGPSEMVPLLPAEQHLSGDGRFHYLGGRLPLAPELCGRVQDLAGRAVATVAGLQGYVGVDVVLGEPDDGCGDQVIEINPRLTTSYVGLRLMARENLAERMLRAAAGKPIGELTWASGAVRFGTDGSVVWEGKVNPDQCR
jgi:predicted ATP-grasp superfamily ATP-dependent carboligase